MLKVDVSGLRVLITAGAAGIGRAMCETFQANGAKVHTCDVDEQALAVLRSDFPGVTASVTDVSDPAQVDILFAEATASLGGLDVMINNAGIAGPTAPVEDISEEDWRRTLDINITGQFFCVRRAVPLLREAGGGSIINLSSAAGIFGFPLRTPYSASKWAVVGVTKSLAMELGKDGIRVNALCPGAVAGERIDRVIAAKAEQRGITIQDMQDIVLGDTSLKTFVTAQDIANMALYLASPAGERISGQAMSVDGHVQVLR